MASAAASLQSTQQLPAASTAGSSTASKGAAEQRSNANSKQIKREGAAHVRGPGSRPELFDVCSDEESGVKDSSTQLSTLVAEICSTSKCSMIDR